MEDINQHPLKFHWRLPLANENQGSSQKVNRADAALPDLAAQIAFAQQAEALGIDSLLTAFGYYLPDPMPLVTAIGVHTKSINFLVAHRPGLMAPTAFVQSINTMSCLLQGRIKLNMVAGHSPTEQKQYGDFLPHHQRYDRMGEFLAICEHLWTQEEPLDFAGQHYQLAAAAIETPFIDATANKPELFLGGSSENAKNVAQKYANCWLNLGGKTPQEVAEHRRTNVPNHLSFGLRFSLIIEDTKPEALAAAKTLISDASDTWVNKTVFNSSDAVSHQKIAADKAAWPTPWLWTGAVNYHGVSAVALVGTPQEIAEAIMAYKKAGVNQFIFSGWPNDRTLKKFGEQVLPLVREMEQAVQQNAFEFAK